MNADEYRMHLTHAYTAVQFLARLPLADMREAINHAETVGPLLDPTLYLTNAQKMAEDKTIVDACLAALRQLPETIVDQLRRGDRT